MECPFCDVPLVEVVSISEIDLNLIASLPYVIAYPLKRAMVEKHPLTRINLLRDTFLNYLKYLGLITASEFFNSPIKDKNMVALFNRTLTETSFGLWNEFIRETLKFLNNKKHAFFCPELSDYYIAVQTGGNRKLYKGEVYVQDAYGETTITKQNLTGIDSLINFRNRYLGHQQTLDDATYVSLWEQYFPIFRDLLVQMTFCADYPMYKTEHGETYRLQSDEIKLTETASQLNANVWIEDRKGNRLDILPFFVVPGELSIKKEDKEQILIYESYTGKSIKFFSPEGTEKLTSGKMLAYLNLLLRNKQQEQPYTPQTFTKEVFARRIADENKLILDTLVAEKKVIPGVYVNRQDMEIKLKEWIGARASVLFIAAEAGSGKTNLLAEMQKQYTERGLNSLLIRAGRMEKQGLTEQIAYLLNIDHSMGLRAYPSLAGTQEAPTMILIDGLNEAFHAENLWGEVLEISQLFEPGSIKFVVAARANSKADLDRYSVSDDEMDRIYGENKDREKGVAALTHWLTALNMEEMKRAWESYAAKDKSRFRPLFTFDDIAGFDRAIYDQINNPLVLRIFLEVYNGKNLPKKGNIHLNIWKDWFATFSDEERTFLDLLAAEVWVKGENELLLDDLLKNAAIKHYLVSDDINAPYQRLKNLGWITRYVKDLTVCIGFTVEGVLLYIFALQLQKQASEVDIHFIDELIKEGSKLRRAGAEAFLSEEAQRGNLNLISELIDAGHEKLELSIRPLLHYLKAFGVEKALANLLVNTTENDWKGLLKLNSLLDNLQYQLLRKEFLSNVLSRISFSNEFDTELGLLAIAEIEDEKARIYFSKINISADFIQGNAILLSALGGCKIRFAEYDEALDFYEKGLNNRLIALGVDHLDVATSYHDLGFVWKNKSEYDKALQYFHKSFELRLKISGSKSPDVAVPLFDIGHIWQEKGEYEKALEFYHQCLGILLKSLGCEHPWVAAVYNNMGIVYNAIGEHDKSLDYYNKSLHIDLKIKGDEDLSIGTLYNNIALLLINKEEYKEALETFEKCLLIQVKNFGVEHPSVATTYNNIGYLWSNRSDYNKALEYYQKALDIRLDIFGCVHLDVATSYFNVGSIFKKIGDLKSALDLYQKGLNIELEILGDEHLTTGTSFFEIGAVFNAKGDYDHAIEFYNRCMIIRQKNLGGNHPSVGSLYGSIGSVLINKRDYKKAIEIFQKGFNVLPKGGFPFKIGQCYEAIGNKSEALKFFVQSANIRKDDPECGLDDEATIESVANSKRLAKELGCEYDLPGWMSNNIVI